MSRRIVNAAAAILDTPQSWNYQHLAAALFIGLILQSLFLPCLCQIGTAKSAFGLVFDALVMLRMVGAFFRHEAGGGWKFYAWLCLTSPAWITAIAWMVFGKI